MNDVLRGIARELREHTPFTLFGAATGVALALAVPYLRDSRAISEKLFDVLHPVHVFLSAMVIAGLHRLHHPGRLWLTLVMSLIGAVGLATVSDSLMPYASERLLGLPFAHAHVGFIEIWWAVFPAALAGIALSAWRPYTKLPHAGHVLVSTWASLFHMTMSYEGIPAVSTLVLIGASLFLAVWLPCCVSDIVYPMLFPGRK